MIIGGTLERFADDKPEAAAIICDNEIVTWRELRSTVDRMSAEIGERTPAGATVGLVLRNSPSMLARFLACARIGREAAILDADWPAARIDAVLRDLAPSLVFSEPGDAACEPDDKDAQAFTPQAQSSSERRSLDPQTSFYVGFTSGSTGQPKGYRRSHLSWLRSFEGDQIEFGVTEHDVILAPGSMTHSLFLYAAVHALHIGATVLMARRFYPAAALRMAARHGATIAYGAPTHWRLMLDAATAPLPGLRWALSSGAKWFAGAGEDIQRLAPNARFAEFYGASELSFVSVRKSGEGCPESSVGRAFAHVTISIRNERGEVLGAGETGRVFVESPYVFSGYAVGSNDIIAFENALSVGDLGFLEPSGFLHLLGRADRMIVTSGKNVFPEEIERALEAVNGVRSAAALGVPDPVRGQKIVALLYPEPNCSLTKAALAESLRERLPAYFAPRQFVIPTQWRWTNTGKTDFRAMRSLWDEGAWEELR